MGGAERERDKRIKETKKGRNTLRKRTNSKR